MKLDEINKRLKRTNIKGKDYIEVNQRILAFRELYPGGRIITRKLADNGSRCDFIAEIYDGETLIATGHSFEFQAAGMVNKTSYVENCVPLDTQILTDRGWRYYYQINEGNLVWSYNIEKGINEFTRVTAINLYHDRLLVNLANSRFGFTCTPQHKWLVREHGKDVYKRATELLTSRHKIVTAVYNEIKPSKLGRMLGWLMCDSELTYTKDRMPSTAYISQAKYHDDVTELFGEGRKVKKQSEQWQDCYEWVIPADEVRKILGVFEIAKYSDLVTAMAKANIEDVAGCYQSMMMADGDRNGFSSTYYDLVEAVQVMCARLGIATNRITSRYCKKSTKPVYTLGIKRTDGAWFSEMKVTNLPPQDVWCPTTENGTWCARQNGFVTMTSNCETSAVGRALGMVGIGIAESIASADEVKAAIEHQQANEEPQNPLQRAQEQLVAAEKQYCAAHGIESWGDFHREQIMTRKDYANTVESLTAIAAELIAES